MDALQRCLRPLVSMCMCYTILVLFKVLSFSNTYIMCLVTCLVMIEKLSCVHFSYAYEWCLIDIVDELKDSSVVIHLFISRGVMPQGSLQRVKLFMLRLEGIVRRLATSTKRTAEGVLHHFYEMLKKHGEDGFYVNQCMSMLEDTSLSMKGEQKNHPRYKKDNSSTSSYGKTSSSSSCAMAWSLRLRARRAKPSAPPPSRGGDPSARRRSSQWVSREVVNREALWAAARS